MKLSIRLLLLLALVFMPAITVSAQSTPDAEVAPSGEPTAFGMGVGSTATYMDPRGNPVYDITVTSFEFDWQDHDEYYGPEVGKVYVKVNMEITNHTTRAAVVSIYGMQLHDSLGMPAGPAYLGSSEDAWTNDVPIEAGETIEGAVVFGIFSDLDPMLLVWQPDYDATVFVYLGD